MQQTANNPPLAAATSTAAVQQVQTSLKLDVPVFESDSAASWLTWSQRVIYQARACGFEAELTAAEGEGLRIGADGFYQSNVDPVRLRNAPAALIVHINSCRGMAPEIVCMYLCMVITYSKGKDQPCKVANSARGRLNRENEFFPVPVRA